MYTLRFRERYVCLNGNTLIRSERCSNGVSYIRENVDEKTRNASVFRPAEHTYVFAHDGARVVVQFEFPAQVAGHSRGVARAEGRKEGC